MKRQTLAFIPFAAILGLVVPFFYHTSVVGILVTAQAILLAVQLVAFIVTWRRNDWFN